MKVYLGGGHEEYMFDIHSMYARLKFEVCEPGIYGEHEGKRGFRLPSTTAEENKHQERISSAVREYCTVVTSDHLACFSTSPSVHEYVMDYARDDVEWFASRSDFAHVLLGIHAAVFAPVMPTVWHFHGQQHQGYSSAIQYILGHSGRVVAYCQQEADLFPTFKLPVIHFGKDSDEWYGWRGDEDSVLYMANSLAQRAEACHLSVFEKSILPSRWWLGGDNNQQFGSRARRFSFDELKEQMKRSRLFFNLGTVPACYTLSVVEAAMTGMPIITTWYDHPEVCGLYAVPDLFGKGCIVLNSPSSKHMERLLSGGWLNRRKIMQMSMEARKVAVNRFSNHVIDPQWDRFIRGWLCLKSA